MKKILLPYLAAVCCLLSLPAFSQDKVDTTNKLGLAGDNLDLYAVLDLFQKSKTIEAFEKSLNDPSNKINNLDLDLDKKIDFIKVVTEKKDTKDESYLFILRVDVSKTESQDIAIILLDRDKDKKVSLQIVGDEEIYGKDYVIEPKGNSAITPNPAYKGDDPVTVTVEAPATNVVVQQAPIVQYVYSPAYVPYYPPYAYGYYPGWFAFSAVMTWGMYASFHSHSHYHGGYYGGHYGGGNNVIINNGDRVNHYNNNNRNRSNTVSDNRARGNYGNGSLDHGRGGGISSRPSNRPGGGSGPSASTRPSTRPGGGGVSASTRPATTPANRSGSGASISDRSSRSSSTRQSSGFSSPSSRSGSYGGGGRSMGGGGRGGGGGRRR